MCCAVFIVGRIEDVASPRNGHVSRSVIIPATIEIYTKKQ